MTHCGNSVFLPAIVAIVLSAASAESPGASPEVLLAEAVAEYRTALDTKDRDARLAAFRNAERLFSLLVRGDFEEGTAGIRNPDLFVNLGNAALGAERLGPAVVEPLGGLVERVGRFAFHRPLHRLAVDVVLPRAKVVADRHQAAGRH